MQKIGNPKGHTMIEKPTYQELEYRVKDLERIVDERQLPYDLPDKGITGCPLWLFFLHGRAHFIQV